MTRKSKQSKSVKQNANKGIAKTYGAPTKVGKRQNRKLPATHRMALCREVCSRADPFCPMANGAKIGDSSSRHTVAFQSKTFVSLATNASGQAALFTPAHPNMAYRIASTFSGTNVATWQANVTIPDYTNLALVYSEFRIVNFGVRVFCEANPTESKGVVLLATIDEVPTSPNIAGTLFPEYERVSLAGMDATWVSRRVGPQSSKWSTFSDTTDYDTTTLFIGVSGATATTSVLACEITINYEFIPNQGSAVTHLATPAPPHNPMVETAVQHVAIAEPSAQLVPVRARTSNFWSLAEKALGAVETYGPMAAAMLM